MSCKLSLLRDWYSRLKNSWQKISIAEFDELLFSFLCIYVLPTAISTIIIDGDESEKRAMWREEREREKVEKPSCALLTMHQLCSLKFMNSLDDVEIQLWDFAESYCKMRIATTLEAKLTFKLCITCTFKSISSLFCVRRNTATMSSSNGKVIAENKTQQLSNRHLNLSFCSLSSSFYSLCASLRSHSTLSTRLLSSHKQHLFLSLSSKTQQPSMLAFIRFSFFSLSLILLVFVFLLVFFLSPISFSSRWNS